MASIKLKLNTNYKTVENTYSVCILLNHKSKQAYIKTGVDVTKNNWDKVDKTVKGIPNSKREQARILKMYS
ncbi:MAG: hypothetical protein HRT72_05495, partial [Flavobacteriales bacterium]|nr:hypothetical protein [Flavobacteriales bacterium]